MSYVVLARKYRPQTFEDVYAQDHVTKILINAIENDRIAHAFLFTGPRGVGKTSMARIMAKTLNCTEGEKGHPCNKCANCVEITTGISSDVVEIDGASNTGVDDIRDLQKDLLYTTNSSKYKIYIIDEVHMLSKNAFNALLKTLEEPPENVIFIFATTEPHKVLPTIISRCQRYDFKRIPVEMIVKNLKKISKSEGVQYEDDALYQIAKKADGGMRDALSLMDQVISTGNVIISEEVVRDVFGILPFEVYAEILNSINTGNSRSVIESLHKILALGKDIIEIINGFLDYLRLCLLTNYGVNTGEISIAQQKSIKVIVDKFDDEDILYMISILMKTKIDMKMSDHPAILLEITLIKLSKIQDLVNIDSLNSKPNTITVVSEQKNAPNRATSYQTSKPAEHLAEEPAAKLVVKREQIVQPKPVPQAVPKQEAPKQEAPKQEVAKPSGVQLDDFNRDVVNQNWDRFNNYVKKKHSLIATFLNRVEIQEVTAKRLAILTESKMVVDKFKENILLIEEYLQEFFGRSIKFDIIYKQKTRVMAEQVTLENIEKKNPELVKLIKDTNSKIINIENK